MTEYKNIIIVETNEAGQPTNLRRLEDGDTISNERLNADVRNAATKIDTVESTANAAAAEATFVSSYVNENQGSWGEGGIDPTTLANLVDTSNAFADFEDNVSGTLAGKDSIDSTSLITGKVVTGGNLQDNTITATQIAPNTITNSEISPTADIAGSQLAAGANIAGSQLASNADIAGSQLASNADIAGSQLAAGANIAGSQLASNADIAGSQLASNADIAGSQLAAGANIAGSQLASNANIAGSQLAAGANIAGSQLASNAGITGSQLASNAGITGSQLASNAGITGFQIADNTLSAGQIKDGEVTNDKLAGSIAASKLAGGIDGTQLAAQADIQATQLAADAEILGSQIADNTLSAGQIFAGTITSNEIADDAITTAKLADNSVDTDRIKANNVTLVKIQNINGKTILGNDSAGNDAVAQIGQVQSGEITSPQSVTGLRCFSPKDVYDMAQAHGGGGGAGNFAGSATASALTIGNTSSVPFSGTDGAALDLPTNGMVPVLDTDAARIKYEKLRGISIADGAVQLENLADGAVDDTKLANSLDIESHIAANNIGFGKLTLISAQTIVGNPEATLGGPMQALTKAQTRNILGVSAGTTAPPSPDAGDLWYNTTDDELYTYDSGRGHWLGAPQYISMGKTTSTGAGVGHFLYVGHQGTAATTQERGWLVPHDMVITGWRAHTKSTFTGWTVRIDKNDGQGTNTEGIVSTGALGAVDTFSDFTLDVDVSAGDILGVALVTGTSTIDNSTVTIKIQRKGA